MAATQPWRVPRAPDVIVPKLTLTTASTSAAIRFPEAELLWDSYLPDRAATLRWQMGQKIKRVIDVIGSLLLLTVLSPIFLLVAFLIKVTSPGPVLYEFRVLGKRARPIVAYKFRTMMVNADELKTSLLRFNQMSGPAFKMRHDPRVTMLGRFLRKYSIDELPQLWSVLIGDMSLVGPRPPFAEEFSEYKPWQWGKLSVTPGITCIWQVSGRSDITDFDEWAQLDLEYIRTWSLALDFKVLLQTIPAVLRGRGAY